MNEEKDVPANVVLTIEFTSEGKFHVTGPLTNEMLCFYMLEKGKDIIKAQNLKIAYEQSQSKIQKPGGLINFARRFK